MKTVHIFYQGPRSPVVLCGRPAWLVSGGAVVDARAYKSGLYLTSSKKWCTDCQDRFPLWELATTELE